MKKIALFVEGQTEQIFTAQLIKEFIGKRGLVLNTYKLRGGKNSDRRQFQIMVENTGKNIEYYFVIYDCGNDNKVQSDIRDRLLSLQAESFSLVIGIRDAYPETDIAKIRKYLYYKIPDDTSVVVNIVLAIQEIESWFMAEETHYSRISTKLSFQAANEIAGMDVSTDSTESIPHPSFMLKQIYIKGGTTYNKSEEKVQRTVTALDYENLYVNVRNRNNSLNELLTCLDGLIP
jgi:hypothetical protein